MLKWDIEQLEKHDNIEIQLEWERTKEKIQLHFC